MIWSSVEKELSGYHGKHVSICIDDRPATNAQVITAWRDDAHFRSFFNLLLASTPFESCRWETPPVTSALLNASYECVIVDAPELLRRPNPSAFANQIENTKEIVAVFPNLGNDALMVVPSKMTEDPAYGHLAAFVRLAPPEQQQALWIKVGEAMGGRVGERPVWLSTAGAGVAWLHVRLDDRPKYYRYSPYRRNISDRQ